MITVHTQPEIRFLARDAFVPRDGERIPNDSCISIWSDVGSSTPTLRFPLQRRWRGVATLEPAP